MKMDFVIGEGSMLVHRGDPARSAQRPPALKPADVRRRIDAMQRYVDEFEMSRPEDVAKVRAAIRDHERLLGRAP